MFSHYGWAVAATALFVVVSQLKINVTNAYAGLLAWSNYFSRLTHSHPGRVVWVVFNTLIALVLMELNVFQALSHVLGLMRNKRRAAPSVSPPPRGGGRRKAAALGALSRKCGSDTFLDPRGDGRLRPALGRS